MDHHHPPTHMHTCAWTRTHTQCRTQPWQSCSLSVYLIFSLAPLPSWEHSWHPEAQRGSNSGLKAVSHFRAGTSSSYQLSIPLFPPFWPQNAPLTLRSWAKDPSTENDLFEGWSGSFQGRFSSRSVSQRCVYVWSSARAPIQECELAEDIIKAMSVLICGLTFKSLCSLRAVFFWLLFLQSISYNMTWMDGEKTVILCLAEVESRLLFAGFLSG